MLTEAVLFSVQQYVLWSLILQLWKTCISFCLCAVPPNISQALWRYDVQAITSLVPYTVAGSLLARDLMWDLPQIESHGEECQCLIRSMLDHWPSTSCEKRREKKRKALIVIILMFWKECCKNTCKRKLLHWLTHIIFTSSQNFPKWLYCEKMLDDNICVPVNSTACLFNACFHYSVSNIFDFCCWIIVETENMQKDEEKTKSILKFG